MKSTLKICKNEMLGRLKTYVTVLRINVAVPTVQIKAVKILLPPGKSNSE